jgi:hypothetical protein
MFIINVDRDDRPQSDHSDDPLHAASSSKVTKSHGRETDRGTSLTLHRFEFWRKSSCHRRAPPRQMYFSFRPLESGGTFYGVLNAAGPAL